jgi:hypothetical protein
MAVLEVLTFRLAADVDEDGFLIADRQAQTECLYKQRGMLRRTTARGVGGEWLVVTVWGSAADADASATTCHDDPAALRLTTFLDPASVTTRRYQTID